MRNRKLEKRLEGSNWAYTGSVAMMIHANRLGLNMPRNIGNINIAAKRPLNLVPIISAKRWKLNYSPEYKKTNFHNKKGHSLDLFPANGRLAPNYIHVVKYPGYPPVMSIKSLLNQKKSINMNDVFGNNKKKIEMNIAFLELLMNKNNK